MGANSCYYTCSGPLGELEDNPDISGIGIKLASSITTGLVLGLVVFYYVFVHRPDISPFQTELNEPTPLEGMQFRPNMIDTCLLAWRLDVAKDNTESNSVVIAKRRRIKNAFEKCMLAMSDFQLITGLSIMISGFTQLKCGIPLDQWRKLVSLVWLSSVTHLCCLTYLREYLYRHKSAQVWRLPGMILLILMLIVALIPTRYDIPRSIYQSYPAACMFGHIDHPDKKYTQFERYDEKNAEQRMVLSVVMLALGTISRIWSLYEAPTRAYMRLRKRCNALTRNYLRIINMTLECKQPVALLLFCRPLLAVILSGKMIYSILFSKILEVVFLSFSFVWGILNLWWLDEPYGASASQQWTFGQVLAILVLGAPIVSLVESSLARGSCECSNSLSHQSMTPVITVTLAPEVETCTYFATDQVQSSDMSIGNFNSHTHLRSPSLVSACVFGLVSLVAKVTIVFMSVMITIDDMLVASQDGPPQFNILAHFGYIGFCVLFSLVLGRFEPVSGRDRTWFHVLGFFVYSVVLTIPHWTMTDLPFLEVGSLRLPLFPFVCTALYLGLSIFEICWRKWRRV